MVRVRGGDSGPGRELSFTIHVCAPCYHCAPSALPPPLRLLDLSTALRYLASLSHFTSLTHLLSFFLLFFSFYSLPVHLHNLNLFSLFLSLSFISFFLLCGICLLLLFLHSQMDSDITFTFFILFSYVNCHGGGGGQRRKRRRTSFSRLTNEGEEEEEDREERWRGHISLHKLWRGEEKDKEEEKRERKTTLTLI